MLIPRKCILLSSHQFASEINVAPPRFPWIDTANSKQLHDALRSRNEEISSPH